jgi:hypothetical protein
LLLLVELVGDKCGLSGNLFREGDGAEADALDRASASGKVGFEEFVFGLLEVSYWDSK